MAKGKVRGNSKAKPEKKVDVFENGDVTFRFDNKSLQEDYIDAIKKYDKLNLNLPMVKVSYVDAVSITKGKDRKRLDDWLDRYDANDNDYKKGAKHKDGMYDKITDSTKDKKFRYQLDKLDKYWRLIQKANAQWGTTTNAGEKVNRYNVVWYSDTGQGASSPV